jgi:hypothetical protein
MPNHALIASAVEEVSSAALKTPEQSRTNTANWHDAPDMAGFAVKLIW